MHTKALHFFLCPCVGSHAVADMRRAIEPYFSRFEILTAVLQKILFFRIVMACRLLNLYLALMITNICRTPG
jgi:hypothetical protein